MGKELRRYNVPIPQWYLVLSKLSQKGKMKRPQLTKRGATANPDATSE
jgi:hypothetical protein